MFLTDFTSISFNYFIFIFTETFGKCNNSLYTLYNIRLSNLYLPIPYIHVANYELFNWSGSIVSN